MLTLHDIPGQCQYAGCDKPATKMACGRESYNEDSPCHPSPDFYCDEHAFAVADEDFPEYVHTCLNCGCLQGIN
jgi:hypothetical protein